MVALPPSELAGEACVPADPGRGEDERRKALLLLEAAEGMSETGGWEWRLGESAIAWTKGAYRIHGLEDAQRMEDAGASMEESLERYDPEDRPRIMALVEGCAKRGEPYSFEGRFTDRLGRRKWIRTTGRAVVEAGKIVAVVGSIMDISARKAIEDGIRRQLDEKVLLLREAHHRIKNNLSSIKELLELRLESSSSAEGASAIRSAAAQIESARVLYESLLIEDGFGAVSARLYLERLIGALLALYPAKTGLRAERRIADLELPPKHLFLVGLALNELMTNSLKYAFSGKGRGRIEVELAIDAEDLVLSIRDDGRGFPAEREGKEGSCFGLSLARMIAAQLGGKLSLLSEGGAAAILRFPRPAPSAP